MTHESLSLLYDTLWSMTQQKSKDDLMMQINLMNEYVDELETGNLMKNDYVQYNKNCMLTTILRNLHKEEHCHARLFQKFY